MTKEKLTNDLEEVGYPLEFQVFALAMKQTGAISRFAIELPAQAVGKVHGNMGLYDFYMAFLDFHRKTKLDIVDPIAFKSWLENETEIAEGLGGIGGVSFFLDEVLALELSTVDSVVKVLKHRASRRQQLNDLQTLRQLLEKKGPMSDDEQKKLTDLTERIRAAESELEYNPLDVVSTGYDIASRIDNLMDIPSFLPTPFKKYNEALGYSAELGGYFRGAVHALVGRSGIGKSTMAKCLCNHWLNEGYKVLFVNYEEAAEHWERILMSQIVKHNVYAESNYWSPQERKEFSMTFADKLHDWGNRLMVRHDPDTSYYEDVEIWLRDLMGHGEKPDVVVIDTINSLFTKGGGQARWGEYEKMMVRLERLAKDMNAVFIITVQQNSNAAKEKREVIEQQDVGGGLTIVQKCSVVTFITDKIIAGEIVQDSIMQLQIPKNRITGKSYISDPPVVRYNDDTKSYEDYDEIEDDLPYTGDVLVAADVLGFGDFNT